MTVQAPSTPTVSGNETIRWTASHPDGGALWFNVDYSPDGTDWTSLATELGATERAVDFSLLPGGEKASIRVTATDGFNTTAALSPSFRVPEKEPCLLYTSPSPRD